MLVEFLKWDQMKKLNGVPQDCVFRLAVVAACALFFCPPLRAQECESGTPDYVSQTFLTPEQVSVGLGGCIELIGYPGFASGGYVSTDFCPNIPTGECGGATLHAWLCEDEEGLTTCEDGLLQTGVIKPASWRFICNSTGCQFGEFACVTEAMTPHAPLSCSITDLQGACAVGIDSCGGIDGNTYSCTQITFPLAEDCSNGIDDDCNGAADCNDAACTDWQTERCGNDADDDCDEAVDCDDTDCQNGVEICGDGDDNDCDQDPVDDVDLDECRSSWDDPANGSDDDGDGQVDESGPQAEDCEQCGRCILNPVDLLTQQAYVGPHEDVRISSPQGGLFDLSFSRVWDSKIAHRDALVGHAELLVLGEGWRHSFDIRLILESKKNTGPLAGELISVHFVTPTEAARMHQEGSAQDYGRVPGRDIHAFETADVGAEWTVVLEDGTRYVFEIPQAETELHPDEDVDPDPGVPGSLLGRARHLRLREIQPQGVTGYRLRLHYAGDSSLPTNANLGLPPGCSGSSCGGVLLAVSQSWGDVGTTLVRGSSLHFDYNTDKRLVRVVEGADREIGPNATRFAELTWGTAAPKNLLQVHSCLDRTNTSGTDISSETCAGSAANGSELFSYTYDAATDVQLLTNVQRVRPSSATVLSRLNEEEFSWLPRLDGPGYLVAHHASLGGLAEAGVPAGPSASREMTWEINGIDVTTEFVRGAAVEKRRGGTILTQRQHARTTGDGSTGAADDQRVTLGVRRSEGPDRNDISLRTFDKRGRVDVEATVTPSGTADPDIVVDSNGGCDTVTFTSGTVDVVRSVAKHYYVDDDVGGREAAVAHWAKAVTSTSPSQKTATTLYFLSAAPSSWKSKAKPSSRETPVDRASCAGATRYWDVDVVDVDSGVLLSDGTSLASDSDGDTAAEVNEPGERQPTWTHTVRPFQNGASIGLVARSSLTIRDSAGRVRETQETEIRSSNGTAVPKPLTKVVGRSFTAFFPLTHSDPRQRGRVERVTAYGNPVGHGADVISLIACATGAWSEVGDLECRDIPQTQGSTSGMLHVTTTTVSDLSDVRTATTSQGTSLFTFSRDLADGTNIESGVLGGNKTRQFWASSAATSATKALHPITVEERDATTTNAPLTRTSIDYDVFGQKERVQAFDLAISATVPQRDATYLTDSVETREPKQETRIVGGGEADVVTSWTRDPQTRDVLSINEPDGDVVTHSVGTVGNQRGKLERVRLGVALGLHTVQQLVYDSESRITDVYNGPLTGPLVAHYDYGDGGRLVKETMNSVPTTGGFFARAYLEEQEIDGAEVRKVARTQTLNGSSIIHDTSTISDGLGRPIALFDEILDVNAVEWFYDKKPAGYFSATPFSVEGTSRTITLTEKTNQLGRVAMIRHPAGVTLYEYDQLGRIVVLVQYEGAPFTTPLDPTKMRVFQMTYTVAGDLSTTRYPSGRRVDNIYGSDHRGPAELLMNVDTTGTTNPKKIASAIAYDVDGRARRWDWGAGAPGRSHVIDRDMLGRVTRIRDISEDAQIGTVTDLQYNNYDGDGDVGELKDLGPHDGVLLASVGDQGYTLGFDADRDMLLRWTDEQIGEHVLTLDTTTAMRTTESNDGITYDYSYMSTVGDESLDRRNANGGNWPLDINLNYSSSRFTSSIDFGNDGTFEIGSLTRGPRTDYVSYTTSSGTMTQARDNQMHRWFRKGGGFSDAYRWGPGGEMAELFNASELFESGQFSRDEYIYLQGGAIGVVHTDNAHTAPVAWWLSPDALGTPRRILQRTAAMAQLVRLVMNPWGKGFEINANLGNYGTPRLPFRLPGQIADASGIVDNNYRTYLPDLGQYLQPDPLHQASVMAGTGPQAYAYSNGNPLKYTDSDGRLFVDRSSLKNCAGNNCGDDDRLVKKFGDAWHVAWLAALNRPNCRAFFEAHGADLRDLLQTNRRPTVSFAPAVEGGGANGWQAQGTGGNKFFISCERCTVGTEREIADTLIHELLHTVQPSSMGLNNRTAHPPGLFTADLPSACLDFNNQPGQKLLGNTP